MQGMCIMLSTNQAGKALRVETFARYVMVLSDRPADPAPMDSLMRRAAVSRPKARFHCFWKKLLR